MGFGQQLIGPLSSEQLRIICLTLLHEQVRSSTDLEIEDHAPDLACGTGLIGRDYGAREQRQGGARKREATSGRKLQWEAAGARL